MNFYDLDATRLWHKINLSSHPEWNEGSDRIGMRSLVPRDDYKARKEKESFLNFAILCLPSTPNPLKGTLISAVFKPL